MDNTFGLLGLLAFFMHATVSLRNHPWLPLWLGRGLTPQHRSVHLRVALCNAFYGYLMLWLATSRIPAPSLLLQLALAVGAAFAFSQACRRGYQFFGTR